MKSKIVLIVLILLMSGCAGEEEKKYSTANFDLIKISEGVYACIHKIGGKAIGNSGIVDNGESTIIFDTFLSPEAAEELIRIVKDMGLSPIRYVVNSHYHNDHIRGNQSFPYEVKILSTRRTAELIKAEEPKAIAAEKIYAKNRYAYFDSLSRTFSGDSTSKEYLNIKMMKPYFEELSESHIKIRTRLPDDYVVNEKSLDGPGRKVSLIEAGKGHTESDLIMYLPEEGILFAGDLVFNQCHPYLGDGYPRELKNRLREMESMDIKVVIPGHGDPGEKETITLIREYVEVLEEIAEDMKSEGKNIDDIKMVRIPEIFKDWLIEDYFYLNLEFIFDQE